MNFTPITKIQSNSAFCALISSEELLQINTNTVSIISVRTGFCKYFYFLPQVPRLFAINPQTTSRFAVVYPAAGGTPESVSLLETESGRVLKQFSLKSMSQKFLHISVGSHLYFVCDSNPSVIYITQPAGTNMSQFDCGSPVIYLGVNYSNTQFFVLKSDKHLVVVESTGTAPKVEKDIPFNPFSFINLDGAILTYGSPEGIITTCNLETGETKAMTTPHSTKPLAIAEGYGVTADGIVFSTDSGETVATVSAPISIRSNGSTMAVVCKNSIQVFESAKKPICTVSQLQPPEPFIDSQFSIEPSIYFSASTAIYSFNFSLNEISKFTAIQEKIKKIATCQACVSVIYGSAEGDKIMTFATGIKKRDEIGIDVLCDIKNQTWILQKDTILAYRLRHLDIEEISRVAMPENHSFDRIFRIGQTVAVYSPAEGVAQYINPNNNNQLTTFRLPQNVSLVQWPALCTKTHVYICRNPTDQYETLTVDDFVCIPAAISSCCWLAKTLFAVENRKVLALSMNGSKRVVDQLPNTMCSIAAALPSELIFVTTLPDLRVVSLKRPFLFVALLDLSPNDTKYLRYILSYMPSLPIDPRAIAGLHPIVAMSVFNKAPPKYVTPKTVAIYARFARFMEVVSLAKASGNNKTIIKLIADAASSIGQFAIAQQLYEEIGDEEALFTLFMAAQNSHNLKILASKSPLATAIQYFGISPPSESELHSNNSNTSLLEYERLQNMQLPRIRSPFTGEEFTLYAGDASEAAPLYPPSFDELSDFGLREYPLTGEEAQQEMQQQADLEANLPTLANAGANIAGAANNSNNVSNSSINANGTGNNDGENADENNNGGAPNAASVEYKERPKVEDKKSDDDLKLDKFFDDDDDEPAQKTISFAIDMSKAPTKLRRGAVKATFSLDSDNNNANGANGAPAEASITPQTRTRRTMTTRAKKFNFDIPGVTDAGANEAPVISPAKQNADAANDLSAIFKSEEVSVKFTSEDIQPNPPFPMNLSGGAQAGSDNEHNSQNVADQFTSNLFMDMPT